MKFAVQFGCFLAAAFLLGLAAARTQMPPDLGPYAALMSLTHNRPIIALVVISDTEVGSVDCLAPDFNDPTNTLHKADFCQHMQWSKP